MRIGWVIALSGLLVAVLGLILGEGRTAVAPARWPLSSSTWASAGLKRSSSYAVASALA